MPLEAKTFGWSRNEVSAQAPGSRSDMGISYLKFLLPAEHYTYNKIVDNLTGVGLG
jgi:hypothetical protein